MLWANILHILNKTRIILIQNEKFEHNSGPKFLQRSDSLKEEICVGVVCYCFKGCWAAWLMVSKSSFSRSEEPLTMTTALNPEPRVRPLQGASPVCRATAEPPLMKLNPTHNSDCNTAMNLHYKMNWKTKPHCSHAVIFIMLWEVFKCNVTILRLDVCLSLRLRSQSRFSCSIPIFCWHFF